MSSGAAARAQRFGDWDRSALASSSLGSTPSAQLAGTLMEISCSLPTRWIGASFVGMGVRGYLLTAAVLDRLSHRAAVFNIKEPSLRIRYRALVAEAVKTHPAVRPMRQPMTARRISCTSVPARLHHKSDLLRAAIEIKPTWDA
jgi:hypothetical protein